MKRSTILAAVLVATTVSVVAGTAAHAAGAQPQSVTITSAAPTGPDAIWDRVNGLGSYVPEGTSSAGLNVYFSVTSDNPDNPACFSTPGALGHPDEPGIITIYWNAPGVCHVHADQPGDEQYAAAPTVTQDVTVEKEISHLSAPQVSKGLLGLTPSTFTTTLQAEGRFGPGIGLFPQANKNVVFVVGGKTLCAATTNSQGVATCTKSIGLVNALLTKEYTVAFAGDALNAATLNTGRLR